MPNGKHNHFVYQSAGEICTAKPDAAELYEHNAYGALMWEIQRTNDQDLVDVWDDRYHPVFEKIKKEYWT